MPSVSRFKSELGGLPFVTVVGNHDIRGTGAAKAYAEYMPARMSEELGCSVKSNNFAFARGGQMNDAKRKNKPSFRVIGPF